MTPGPRSRDSRCIPAGSRAALRSSVAAFTLLELIVVVALLGTVLALTLPRLESPGLHDALEQTALRLLASHRRLKEDAAGRRLCHTLHLDLDRQRIWVSNADMDEEQLLEAAEEGYVLPRHVRLERLRIPDGREIGAGAYEVRYFPDGHGFMVAIDLAEPGGRCLTLSLEPFLTKARIVNEDGPALFF